MSKYDYNFQCFKNLRQEMFRIHYNMYPFEFRYNDVNTFVAAYIITNEERTSDESLKYVLFRLIFMKQNDLDDTIECLLNVNGIVDYQRQSFRNFFEIDNNPNAFGDFMEGFCNSLNNQCPEHAIIIQRQDIVRAECHSLCRKLNLDPEHCYRRAIVRLGSDTNGKQKHRNPNKFQLALIKFPHAAVQYEGDTTVTYSFTNNEEDEVDEAEAIRRFTLNEQRRLHQQM